MRPEQESGLVFVFSRLSLLACLFSLHSLFTVPKRTNGLARVVAFPQGTRLTRTADIVLLLKCKGSAATDGCRRLANKAPRTQGPGTIVSQVAGGYSK